MTLDLGALVRSAALSGSGYFEGQRAKEERERRRQIEDEEMERRRRQAEMEEQERLIRMSALAREANTPELPPRFKVNASGITQEFDSEEEARAFRDRNLIERESAPRPSTVRVTQDGVTREFPDTDEGREEALVWRSALSGGGAESVDGKSDLQRRRVDIAESGLGQVMGTGSEPDPDTQMLLDMIRRENQIRMELVQRGVTDPQVVEAEVRRRLGGG